MVRKPRIIVALALALAAILAFATYFHFWISIVSIANKSDGPLSDVKVEFAGNRMWQGNLAAGKVKHTLGVVDGGGEAIVSYVKPDGTRVEIRCGYVTGGPMAVSMAFTLKPDADGCGYR